MLGWILELTSLPHNTPNEIPGPNVSKQFVTRSYNIRSLISPKIRILNQLRKPLSRRLNFQCDIINTINITGAYS